MDLGRIILGSLLYLAGSAILYVFPAYLSDLGSRLGINEAQLGSITAAENIGIALASALSIVWIGRFDRRRAAIAAAVACAGFDIVAMASHSFAMLMAARFLTGLFGEGVLFALAFVVLGSTRNPDRSIGIALTVTVTFGSLVLGAAPGLGRLPFAGGVLLPLALASLAVIFAVRWMPRAAPAVPAADRGATAPDGIWRAVIGLIAMATWYAAPGAFWAFAESAALDRQIPATDISVALAIGNAVGLLGSGMTVWQGDRWGRAWPIAISTMPMCLAVFAFSHSQGIVALAVALSAFNIFWNYGAVYQMALVTALDPAGRLSVAISAAQVVGMAGGGFLSGLIIYKTGFADLPVVVSALAVIGLALFLPCFRGARPMAPA